MLNDLKMYRLGAYFAIVLVVILLLYSVTYYYNNDESDEDAGVGFPGTIGALELRYDHGGERAMSEIENMHMGDFEFEEGYIGYYESSGGASAYFWISVCSDDAAAVDLIEKMTAKISTVDSPFSTPVSVADDHPGVEHIFYTSGTGQDHYYWQDGRMLIWVALDNMNTSDIDDFMKIAVEEF